MTTRTDHRPILDLSVPGASPPPPSSPPPQSPSGVIKLSNTQTLTVTDRGDGVLLLTESQTSTGPKRFHLAVPLAQLPTLIDFLCAVEQAAIDRGQLPERDDGDDGAGAQP